MDPQTMATPSIRTDTDPISRDLISCLGSTSGPCVTLHLPTHRKGAEVRQDPIRLRNLVDTAAHQLRDTGVSAGTVATVLDPARALIDDVGFWQHQADGLSVFAAPGVFEYVRVGIPLAESVTVSDTFHLAPLVPLLTGDGPFLLLALSQNEVRLFEATRDSMVERDLGEMPRSMAEALEHEDPERQLQARSSGVGEAMFHGHGSGSEQDKAAIERYLRAVDHGLHGLLGADERPLVLACVGYYVPIFRSVSRHRPIVDHAVEGNPERAQPAELHASAWDLVAPLFNSTTTRAVERFRAALGTGDAIRSLDEILERAREGRVEVLVLDPSRVEIGDSRLDRAIFATFGTSGDVVAAAGELPTGTVAGAVLRY